MPKGRGFKSHARHCGSQAVCALKSAMPRYMALLAAQPLFGCPKPTQVVDFPVASDGKGFQTHIDAHRPAVLGQRFCVYQAGEAGIPFFCFPASS
jgi:hypothetical protein